VDSGQLSFTPQPPSLQAQGRGRPAIAEPPVFVWQNYYYYPMNVDMKIPGFST